MLTSSKGFPTTWLGTDVHLLGASPVHRGWQSVDWSRRSAHPARQKLEESGSPNMLSEKMNVNVGGGSEYSGNALFGVGPTVNASLVPPHWHDMPCSEGWIGSSKRSLSTSGSSYNCSRNGLRCNFMRLFQFVGEHETHICHFCMVTSLLLAQLSRLTL